MRKIISVIIIVMLATLLVSCADHKSSKFDGLKTLENVKKSFEAQPLAETNLNDVMTLKKAQT